MLDNALTPHLVPFDFVLFDTPSGLGSITRAALAASDFVLVPFQTEHLALRSLGQTLRVVEQVAAQENPALKLLGIVPTMLERDNEVAVSILADVWTQLSGVVETAIPRDEVFARASARGLPVSFLGGPPSPEAARFDALAGETEFIIARLAAVEEDHEGRPDRQLL